MSHGLRLCRTPLRFELRSRVILCAQDHKPIRVYNVLMMLEYFAQVVPVYCFIASRTAIKSLAWET